MTTQFTRVSDTLAMRLGECPTYFVHLSLSSVDLTDSSAESPVLIDVVHPGRAWSSSPACTWHCSLRHPSLLVSSWCSRSTLGDARGRCLDPVVVVGWWRSRRCRRRPHVVNYAPPPTTVAVSINPAHSPPPGIHLGQLLVLFEPFRSPDDTVLIFTICTVLSPAIRHPHDRHTGR